MGQRLGVDVVGLDHGLAVPRVFIGLNNTLPDGGEWAT
jgi:hypothetical protein